MGSLLGVRRFCVGAEPTESNTYAANSGKVRPSPLNQL